jgi:hypothetical protein
VQNANYCFGSLGITSSFALSAYSHAAPRVISIHTAEAVTVASSSNNCCHDSLFEGEIQIFERQKQVIA